jgi:hypothetical protein
LTLAAALAVMAGAATAAAVTEVASSGIRLIIDRIMIVSL